MTLQEAREKLAEVQHKGAAYNHAVSLIYYDGVTGAPEGVADNRAQTLAVFSEEMYRLSTGKETAELLEYLDANRAELSRHEARQIDLMLKDLRMMEKIPLDEYVAFQRLMVQADDVWHKAKESNDWALFEPVLEKVFDYHKKIAAWCAPDKPPYDYWLDRYEEGLTTERCEAFFAALRERIVPLLKRVLARPQLDDSVLHGSFPADRQEAFARRLMDVIGLDRARVGLATTEHPFTTSMGSHLDERITTHYHEDDFSLSMYSVIHEGGHALYDTGSARELAYTVLDGGVSMGIHESQSRFYENIIGRSRAFCEYILPVAAEYFPELKGRTAEELYRAVNRAQPGLIRIEADELTYALHVMVRFELEKRIFADELAVRDLPAEWNRLYKEYLGVDVPDDKHGVLQDSHWAGGNIGYFPSYALGSAYGAQYLRKMKETVDVDACVRAGDLAPINDWLRERIWQHGCLYRPGELFERAVGEPFDPTVFASYLEQKYTELYQLD
ncbi:MAG: carboxypeptidase M32 [Oscillospiraceae bacterium]|nr:carboxypeptidase M32 [Oscillospiraceae bacterium]